MEKWLAVAGLEMRCLDPPSSFEKKLASDLQRVCLADCHSSRAKVMLFIGQSLAKDCPKPCPEDPSHFFPIQDSCRGDSCSACQAQGEIVRLASESGSFLCPVLLPAFFPSGVSLQHTFCLPNSISGLLPGELT